MARLARIDIFPIKSLDGCSLPQVALTSGGALVGDRTHALFDAQQRYINGKRHSAIHALRSRYSDDGTTLHLSGPNLEPLTAALTDPPAPALTAWFSRYFQQPVTLATNEYIGFPDDSAASGPTLVSTATLETVASWFPGLSVEAVRRRFRTNLEIDGVPPFWEDRLFSAGEEPVGFRLGAVVFQGINPCQRCIVPTRDAQTGEPWSNFQRTFNHQRQATLPAWAAQQRFNHFYRLAVNTWVPETEAGKVLRVGDALVLEAGA